jgi:tetratricopeptide (TPR) repeat protein
MKTTFGVTGLLAVCVFLTACASGQLTIRQECYDPDAQLRSLLNSLEINRARGCWDREIHDPPSVCNNLQREIERLALVCPAHVPTLMTNAVLAHDAGQSVAAQQYLDRIFERPSSHPDAAALRARLAIEDGNIPFARRFAEQQIRLAPDHSGLREAHAAALYLTGQMNEARSELTRAEALGAPRWRIAYHVGLIEEAAGRLEEAQRLYAEAVEKNPGWGPAESRLKGLMR